MLNPAMSSALCTWKMKTTALVLASKAWLLSVAYRASIGKTLLVVHPTAPYKMTMPKSFLSSDHFQENLPWEKSL